MIVTRFAPSPTGYLHIGGLRTALLSYLWARKNGGKFLLRIEDTDFSRNDEAAAKAIVDAFKWVGLEHDGEIEYQSSRLAIYQEYANKLLDEGKAYRCYMSKEELDVLRESQMAAKERAKYDNRYRDFTGTPPEDREAVIRIKSPLDGIVTVDDGIKGKIDFNVSDMLDDFVILRADGTPTYNFVVAVDDALMGVTDVIRGDDHLSNTPKQIVVYNALGFNIPRFFHVPMIHNSEGKKLSKRDGATDVMAYKDLGYLPEALLNFLVRLGWSHKDQEVFSMSEMIELFNPSDINRSASVYNTDKLDWLNAHYIKNTTNEKLFELLKYHGISEMDEVLFDAIKERSKTLVDFATQISEIKTTPTSYDEAAVKKAIKSDSIEILESFLGELSSDYKSASEFHSAMDRVVEKMQIGFGKIGQPLRLALLGKLGGPGLDVVMASVGYNEVKKRVEAFLDFANN